MLAIYFGCQKFHQYVYMRQVDVETDHKPLQAIFSKPLHDAPPRLQKMLLSLQRYDIRVAYRPGRELLVADHLSRSYLKESTELPEIEVNLLAYLPVSDQKLRHLQAETSKDDTLQEIILYIQNGWPTLPSEVSLKARPYWTFREEMTITDGLVFKNYKLVVPTSTRKEMLNRIHESHQGVVKCKNRARETLFWPGLATDIEKMIANCEICAKYQNANPPETLRQSEVPDRAWSKIGTDLFEFKGNTYLLTIDYFSKWPEMVRLEDTTSKTVILHLKSLFARYGIPDIVMSDNGPRYASAEFRQFAAAYDFKHVTSSPKYPQSNGQAERTVQTLKNILRKATYPYKGILDYKNSPIGGIGKSPAQLFMGRRLRSTIPVTTPLLTAESSARDRKALVDRQTRQLKYYPGQRDLKPLNSGNRVMMKDDRTWIPAEVIDTHITPRSYILKAENGRTYRRNRRDLRETRRDTPAVQDPAMQSNTATNSSDINASPSSMSAYTESSKNVDTTRQVEKNHTEKSESSMQSTDSSDRPVTRSGRAIVKPARFRD